jgi:gluconokinase
LYGNQTVLQARINARKGHFMPPSLLESQLATLELPGLDERARTIDIDQRIEKIFADAVAFLT